MREQLNKISSVLFGILISVGVGLGAVAFVLFIIALVVGGDSGASISITGKKLINSGIRISSLGILAGLVKIYTDGSHYLTLKKKKDKDEGVTA